MREEICQAQLKLLVLRTRDIRLLAEFYTLLGVVFTLHQHDNSPYHYTAILSGNLVLEIYPLSKYQTAADMYLRLGFSVQNLRQTLEHLLSMQIAVLSEIQATDFGYSAVVKDPDGRKVELYEYAPQNS